jgi:hypothetical protein
MQNINQAFQFSRTQASIAGEVGKAMTSSIATMFEASMAFAGAMLSVKSPESFAELQRAFLKNSMQSASVTAARIADACASAAKQYDALATQSGANLEKSAP